MVKLAHNPSTQVTEQEDPKVSLGYVLKPYLQINKQNLLCVNISTDSSWKELLGSQQ